MNVLLLYQRYHRGGRLISGNKKGVLRVGGGVPERRLGELGDSGTRTDSEFPAKGTGDSCQSPLPSGAAVQGTFSYDIGYFQRYPLWEDVVEINFGLVLGVLVKVIDRRGPATLRSHWIVCRDNDNLVKPSAIMSTLVSSINQKQELRTRSATWRRGSLRFCGRSRAPRTAIRKPWSVFSGRSRSTRACRIRISWRSTMRWRLTGNW